MNGTGSGSDLARLETRSLPLPVPFREATPQTRKYPMAAKKSTRGRRAFKLKAAIRAFAKSVEVFADDLKPKTQNLRPINQSFVSSIKPWVEGIVYRL